MHSREEWQNMWSQNDIPWTGEQVNDALFNSYEKISALIGKPVEAVAAFVPLAGNSPAVRFLYDKGLSVTALEYVPEAVERMKRELFPELSFSAVEIEPGKIESGGIESGSGRAMRHRADRLVLLEQDIFECSEPGAFDIVYDRGALVAISPADRRNYARIITNLLSPGGVIFFRVAEFVGGNFQGPPYSIDGKEVRRLFPSLELVEEITNIAPPTQERFISAGIKETAFRNILLRAPALSVSIDSGLPGDDSI